MSVTITGLFFIVGGIYGLLLNKAFLYDITIFFIPFSATAIINIGSGDTGTAISPYLFLGFLWLISFGISRLNMSLSNKGINRSELLALSLLIIFAGVAFLSLIMPLIINGSENGNVSGELDSSDPITFTSKNITQYIYLLFGIIMAIAFYWHNKNQINFGRTLKIYALSVIFIMCWGGIELFCYYTNLSYPDFIFNNSISKYAGGFNGFLGEGGIKRISSVAVEPSILVQSILIFIPFLIFGLIRKQYFFGKKRDALFLIISYVFILRTTSTVGIVCLGLLSILALLFYFKSLGFKSKLKLISLSIAAIPVFIAVVYALFNDIINQVLFNKSESYSSLERASAIYEAWGTFLKHPLLGTGWGSVSSFDLFVKLLSNTGVVGAFLFMCFLIVVFYNQSKTKNAFYGHSVVKTSISIAYAVLIFSNMINGFSFVFGFFWLATGLVIITGTEFFENYEVIDD